MRLSRNPNPGCSRPAMWHWASLPHCARQWRKAMNQIQMPLFSRRNVFLQPGNKLLTSDWMCLGLFWNFHRKCGGNQCSLRMSLCNSLEILQVLRTEIIPHWGETIQCKWGGFSRQNIRCILLLKKPVTWVQWNGSSTAIVMQARIPDGKKLTVAIFYSLTCWSKYLLPGTYCDTYLSLFPFILVFFTKFSPETSHVFVAN